MKSQNNPNVVVPLHGMNIVSMRFGDSDNGMGLLPRYIWQL
jgi:hypothetical protein